MDADKHAKREVVQRRVSELLGDAWLLADEHFVSGRNGIVAKCMSVLRLLDAAPPVMLVEPRADPLAPTPSVAIRNDTARDSDSSEKVACVCERAGILFRRQRDAVTWLGGSETGVWKAIRTGRPYRGAVLVPFDSARHSALRWWREGERSASADLPCRRRQPITKAMHRRIERLLAQGFEVKQVAEACGVSVSVVYKTRAPTHAPEAHQAQVA
jgi:hypothetical protein